MLFDVQSHFHKCCNVYHGYSMLCFHSYLMLRKFKNFLWSFQWHIIHSKSPHSLWVNLICLVNLCSWSMIFPSVTLALCCCLAPPFFYWVRKCRKYLSKKYPSFGCDRALIVSHLGHYWYTADSKPHSEWLLPLSSKETTTKRFSLLTTMEAVGIFGM